MYCLARCDHLKVVNSDKYEAEEVKSLWAAGPCTVWRGVVAGKVWQGNSVPGWETTLAVKPLPIGVCKSPQCSSSVHRALVSIPRSTMWPDQAPITLAPQVHVLVQHVPHVHVLVVPHAHVWVVQDVPKMSSQMQFTPSMEKKPWCAPSQTCPLLNCNSLHFPAQQVILTLWW